MKKWLKNLLGLNKEAEPLEEEHIKSFGFKETLRRSHFIYYKKGKLTLKWDFHVEHNLITIKWNKSMRFFGNVETKDQLSEVLERINKYFGKSE